MHQDLEDHSTPSHLTERILNSVKMVVLSSPAGFGKTELLKQLYQVVSQTPAEAHWFDRYDHKHDETSAANSIENKISSIGTGHHYYFIDDADLTDQKALISVIERAIQKNPELRFVLALRTLRKFPIARLQVNDMVDVIDGTALLLPDRFAKRILSKSVGRRWHIRIRDISKGWPVALKSLARWVSSVGDAPEDWATLEILKASGFDSYIEQEVVPDFDEPTRRVLAYASQFDCWNAALFAAIVPDENFDSIFPDLPHRFAGLIDRVANGFSLHPLLKSYFSHKFLEFEPERRKAFLIAAADYKAENGSIAEAGVLANQAGVPERIEKYSADHGTLRIWVSNDYSVIKSLVDQAGPIVVSQSVRLKLMQCIVHMKDGLIKEAEALYQQVAAAIDEDHELKSQAEVVRVTLLVYGCNLERADDLEDFERLFDKGKNDPVWRSLLATLSCILHSQRGRFDQALRSLEDARTSAKLANSTYNLMFLNLHQAGIHIARGELKSARLAMTNARSYWRKEFHHDKGVQTVISALSSSIEFESGQLTTARNSLKKSAYQMPDSEAWFDIYIAAYEAMARMLVADKSTEAALRSIRENQRKLSAHGLSRVENILGGLAICLWGEERLKGNLTIAKPSVELPFVSSTATWHEREIYSLARAHLLIADGHILEALELLETEMKFSVGAQLRRSELRYRLLLTLIHLRLKEQGKAERMLSAALLLGAETGHRQVFVEMASIDGIHQMLGKMQLKEITGSVNGKFITRLLSAKERSVRKCVATVLTSRETEILSALANGGSDKMLAREFGITEHGIRFHLKNIYQKLAVHDRVSAIAIARKAELV